MIGEKGTACWDGARKLSAEIVVAQAGFNAEHRAEQVPTYDGPRIGGHTGVVRDFVECIRSGRIPETICTDNIKSLAMVFGAVQSAEEGRVVLI